MQRDAQQPLFALPCVCVCQACVHSCARQYTVWFPRIFPGTGAVVVAQRVAFDQLINTGLWYYPLFYMVQSCVMNARFTVSTASEGLERYKHNIKNDMMNVRCSTANRLRPRSCPWLWKYRPCSRRCM